MVHCFEGHLQVYDHIITHAFPRLSNIFFNIQGCTTGNAVYYGFF